MIRTYSDQDKEELIKILQLNTPKFFDPSEEKDFLKYLENEIEHYYVIEESGKIIGSGGFNLSLENKKTAWISWGMIHPDFQGKGVGTKLTRYRIEQIKKIPSIDKIIVRTTQLVFPFYEKMGFLLKKTAKDFWGKDLDLYHMEMDI